MATPIDPNDQLNPSMFLTKSFWRRLLTGVLSPALLAATTGGLIPSSVAAVLFAIGSGVAAILLAVPEAPVVAAPTMVTK